MANRLHTLFDREFAKMEDRGWDKIYVAIDFHDTIAHSSYNSDDHSQIKYFPKAIECLKRLSDCHDICLILWTSSHKDYYVKHLRTLADEHDIIFEYVNENPECPSIDLANFDSKFYFNAVFDDKAGFDGNTDWSTILEYWDIHYA